jgi:phage replication O-like protein O
MTQKLKYDDGNFTIIPNELLDALTKCRIGPAQRQCLDYIIRKTFGWHKTSDGIPLTQFYKATGIEKRNVIRCLKSLENRNIIVLGSENKRWKTYQINTRYKTWKKLEKRQSQKNPGNSEKVLSRENENVLNSENKNGKNVLSRENLKRNIKKNSLKESAEDQKKNNEGFFFDLGLAATEKIIARKKQTEEEREARILFLRKQVGKITE